MNCIDLCVVAMALSFGWKAGNFFFQVLTFPREKFSGPVWCFWLFQLLAAFFLAALFYLTSFSLV